VHPWGKTSCALRSSPVQLSWDCVGCPRSDRRDMAQTQHSCYEGQTEGRHFAFQAEGEMKPLKTGLRRRRTARIRGDFVAPDRNAKSPTMSREHREPRMPVHKASFNKDFRYFALGDTSVGFRPIEAAGEPKYRGRQHAWIDYSVRSVTVRIKREIRTKTKYCRHLHCAQCHELVRSYAYGTASRKMSRGQFQPPTRKAP
jgi:hypothetical protein